VSLIAKKEECYHCTANHPEFVRAFDIPRHFAEPGGFPLKRDTCSLSLDGGPVCTRLFGDFGTVPTSEWTYRIDGLFSLSNGFSVFGNPDHAVVRSYQPVAIDRTTLVTSWFVPPDAVEGVDYETANVVAVWHHTNAQDAGLCASVERGIRSRGYAPGPKVDAREPGVLAFHRRYRDWLREPAAVAVGAP
jgi:Rieske 2Fe-2S family protein